MAASAVALALYFVMFRPRQAGRIASFVSGLALLILIAASPLDPLARHYLLSAAVIVQVTAAQAVPLLLIAGISPTSDAPTRGSRVVPYAGWIAGCLTITIWFIPALFNSTLAAPWLWDVMQLTLVLGGVIFWWPLFGPAKARRVKPVPTGIWYLFGAMIWCSFAGMLLAFTNPDSYQPYVRVHDSLGILSFIRNDLELGRTADQDTAGLFLWIGTMAILLSAIMALFYQWYYSPEVRHEFELRQAAAVKKAREGQA